jgi:hypothetical protein
MPAKQPAGTSHQPSAECCHQVGHALQQAQQGRGEHCIEGYEGSGSGSCARGWKPHGRVEQSTAAAAGPEHIPHLTTRTARGDGTVAVAAVEERVTWWMLFAADAYPLLAKAAGKLLGMHVTTCAPERNKQLGSSSPDCDATEQLCVADEQEEWVEELSE